MRNRLIVQIVFQSPKKTVELTGVDNGPWNDNDAASVETSYKVVASFVAYNLLELRTKPVDIV